MLNGFAGRVRTLGVAALLACATMFCTRCLCARWPPFQLGASASDSRDPVYSVGYSDCRHCGGGYFSGSVYGGYYPGGYYGGGWSNGYNGGYYSSHYPSSYYRYPSSYYGGLLRQLLLAELLLPGRPLVWRLFTARPMCVAATIASGRSLCVESSVMTTTTMMDRRGRDYDDGSYYPGRDYGDRDRQYLQTCQLLRSSRLTHRQRKAACPVDPAGGTLDPRGHFP
jgi:hypothetical protein